jgi:hypothetical protein
MTVLRCTAKLRKRLKLPNTLPEPVPHGNPLGEWYADIDVWNRKPFVVMLNAATGVLLVLNGNAAGLRALHERAFLQFASLCEHFEIRGPAVDAELQGFDAGFTFGPTRDRSLLSSLNQRKVAAWMGFEHNGDSLFAVALSEWDFGFFQHPTLGKPSGPGMHWHRPRELLSQRVQGSANVLPFKPNRA